MAVIAGLTRQPWWALCTSIVATFGINHLLHPAAPLLALILGGQILAWQLIYGPRLNSLVVAIGATLVAVGLGTGSQLCGIENPCWLSLLSALLMLPGLVRQRTRNLALLPLALPLTGQLSAMLWQHPAWCAIGSAFLLLGIGAWRSHHTAHHA